MEVDATIQEDLVEDDAEYISGMKLAVSEDEDGGGADSGGCRVDTTTMTKANRENGGAGDMASSNCNKRKFDYDIYMFVGLNSDVLYGFDEEIKEPSYGPIYSSSTDVNAVAEEVEKECVVVPPKKSRPSIEACVYMSQVPSSSPPSPSISGVSPVVASIPVPIAPVIPVTPAVNKPRTPKDDFYKKPFEFGWKREVVMRANPEASKEKADVYYFAPSGKKMRSKNEIIPLLEGELTIEHFCFAREPLGLSPDLETVRSAKPTHRSNVDAINSSTSTSSGKRVSKPKVPKGASPPPQGWTPTRALKNSSSLNTNSNSSAAGSNTTASPKTTPKSSKSRKVGDPQPCTMQCAAAMGMIPQLQCIKCLCLYHHDCVGLDRKDNQYRVMSDTDGGGHGQHHHRKDYVCQSCIPPAVASALKENHITLREPEKQILLAALCQPPPPPPPLPTSIPIPAVLGPLPVPIVSTMPAVAPAAVLPVSTPTIATSEPAAGDLPQSIAVIKGKKYVVVKKPLIQRSTAATTTAVAAENNNVESIAENDVGTNERSKRNNNSSNAHKKQASATSTSTTSASAAPTTTTAAVQSLPLGNIVQQAQHTSRSPDSLASSGSPSSSLSFASNFFANVSVGYDAILHIMKYLKIHERPRAASVCKIWNLVAKDRSLWQTVRMKNSKVGNWAGFTAALRRGETKHLDLRKLLVSSTQLEDTWSEFCDHIGSVSSLEHIDMCRCSVEVVENLFVTNRNLTYLSALAINDDTINLVNIKNLVKLEELRLRTLEKCTLIGDLTPLSALKNLRHLTLSSVRQLGTKEIEVIGELSSLISLELGECNDFDSRFTDNVLPKLSNLERLRLEIGQEQCRTLAILDSVAKLEKLSQLEFVNFDIKPVFDDKLAQCTNIKKLLIIPTYISQSATTNNIVLNAVLKLRNTLQVFTWAVTVELLRVTALYVDQCEDSTRKERRHFDECIPVLKPVPGSVLPEPVDGPSAGVNAVPQIEILPLDKVEEILRDNLATTKFTIVKVPYHATWKQQLVD